MRRDPNGRQPSSEYRFDRTEPARCLPIFGSKSRLNATEEDLRGLAGGICREKGAILNAKGCCVAANAQNI